MWLAFWRRPLASLGVSDRKGVRVGPLLIGTGALLSLALLAGRVAGFARELILSSTLGVSRQADAAVLLLTLPDLLVNLLLSGGLSVALIPLLRAAAPREAAALFVQASLAVAGAFGVLALAIGLAPMWWLALLAPGAGFTAADSQALFSHVGLVALAVPLTALAGVSTASLNARDRFFAAGCGTLVFNLCVIAGLFFAPTRGAPLDWLCWGIVGGALLRWLSQIAALPRQAWRAPAPGLALNQDLFRSFGAAFLASSAMLLVPVIVRALASLLGEGTIAAFNYATKVVELPVGILITTLGTVAFPHLSELHAQGRPAQAHQRLVAALQRSAVLSAAVLLIGLWFADAVVALLFLRGRIDPAAVAQITLLTQVALLSVPFMGMSSLAAASLNAQRRTALVLWNTLACLALLPVLAAPGIVLKSSAWLMFAVVLFQAALALCLMRAAGIRMAGASGWVTRRMLGCLMCMASLALIFGFADGALGLRDARWRSAFAVAAFAATALAGVRFLSARRGAAADEKTD